MKSVKHSDIINMFTGRKCSLCGHNNMSHITFEGYRGGSVPTWFKPCGFINFNEYTFRSCGCMRYIDCLNEEG